MSHAALLLVSLGLFAAAARGRPALTLGVLIGTTLLVPSELPVSSLSHALVTVPRVVEAGALIGLLVAARRGRLGPRPFAAHVVMIPLLAYLAVIAVTGLGTAQPGVNTTAGWYLWLAQAEQAVVLLLALALGRSLPARTILLTLAVTVAAVDLIAVGEYLTGQSWAHELFRAAPSAQDSLQAGALQKRGPYLRVRAAGDFALQTGWVLAALLPAVLGAAAATWRRAGRRTTPLLLLLLVPLDVVAVALTRSRSPLGAAAVLLVLVLLTLSRRRPGVLAGAVLLTVGGLLALGPALLARVAPSVDQGSIDVRVQRLPEVLALPAAHPLRGVGLSGIQTVSLPGVDTSYVLAYVETGVLAAALLAVLLLFATGSVLRGLRRPRWPGGDPDDRLLGFAAALGALTLVASATTMDTFQALASNRLTWLLVGFGLAVAERRRGVQPLPSARAVLGPARLAAVLLALGVGVGAALLTPTHAASRTIFATVGADQDAAGVFPGSLGRTFVDSTCQLADQLSRGHDWAVSSCGEQGPPGWGYLRLQGPDRATVEAAGRTIFAKAHGLAGMDRIRVGLPAEGVVVARPTAAKVAPWVLTLLALCAVLLLPGRIHPRPRATGSARFVTV